MDIWGTKVDCDLIARNVAANIVKHIRLLSNNAKNTINRYANTDKHPKAVKYAVQRANGIDKPQHGVNLNERANINTNRV